MEASSLIQPNPGLRTSTGVNFGVADTSSHTRQPVNTAIAPVSDTLTLSSDKIVAARQVLTQQIDIALNLNSPAASLNYPADSSRLIASDAFSQNLADKVVQKIHDDDSSKSDHESDDDHYQKAVKTVSMQVSQGFEQATAVINRLGIHNYAVAGDVAQSRAQVDQAIEREAARPTPSTDTIAAFDISTRRELSTSLQVTTQDGDTVTINLTRSQELTTATASNGNSSLAYQGSSSSTQIDFTVQGDLSEKERESIEKVVEQVSELAKKVFNGKTGAAMERLSEFKIDTRQLTEVALSMSSSITQQAVGLYAEVSRIPVGQPALAQAPDRPAATSTPAVGSASVSNPAVSNDIAVNPPPVHQVSQEPVADVATQVVQDATEVVNNASSSASFENPFKEIGKLFEQIADLFAKDNHISNAHNDFIKALFGNVIEKLEHDHDDDD